MNLLHKIIEFDGGRLQCREVTVEQRRGEKFVGIQIVFEGAFTSEGWAKFCGSFREPNQATVDVSQIEDKKDVLTNSN